MSIGDTLIGKTVRSMIGDNKIEGVAKNRSDCSYLGGGKGRIYKIRSGNGIVEYVSTLLWLGGEIK